MGLARELDHADEIWHLGDFCDGETLAAIKGVGKPLHGVLGNNDFDMSLPATLRLERGGATFFLIHICPRRIGGADFLLHGHTHVPRDQVIGNTRVLNPGAIGRANKGAPPSWAWLVVDQHSRTIKWSLNPA